MQNEIVVQTTAGRLRGESHDGVAAFKGVPYGEAVSGRRRWQRSSPVAPWSGVRDAAEFGPRAVQPESRDMRTTSPELEDVMAAGGPPDDRWSRQSEECLTLSVWTPDTSADRRHPVLFWCHGGKYFGEVPPVWWFDGENLARRENVVVVAVRHRVGALGFLHLADLPGGSAYEDAANVGMLDLVDALKWVRDNMAGFGGDPGNVTIFGESGGGLKVSVLLRMPEAAGLFQKAIVQSGAQTDACTRSEGAERTIALMAELGLDHDDLEGLLDVPSKHLVEAQVRLAPRLWSQRSRGKFVEFEPILDGRVLPADCFDHRAAPVSKDIPLLVGTCATETTWFLASEPELSGLDRAGLGRLLHGMLGARGEQLLRTYEAASPSATTTETLVAITGDFMFRRKAIRMAELNADHGDAAVYMYLLAYETDVCERKYGTPHTLDVPLVFAHPDHPMLGTDPDRFAVSEQMSGAWAAFARTGNPNTGLLPEWPKYDTDSRATMSFGALPEIVFDPRSAEREVWS